MVTEGHASVDRVSKLVDDLQLELADTIEQLPDEAGELHTIFNFTIKTNTDDLPSLQKCVLRVSKPTIPNIKTSNEVAVMDWVRQRTSIPIPKVIANDPTIANALQREFTLLEFCKGTPLSKVLPSLPADEQRAVMDQIIDHVEALHSPKWNHIGGLIIHKADRSEKAVPGPMVDAHFFIPEDKAVPDPLSHNAYGPFPDFAIFCSEQLSKSWGSILLVPSLEGMRDLAVPKLLGMLASPAVQGHLNANLEYTLAHRDMHLGNLLYDKNSQLITAILDWELAAVVPTQLWNPGNFLWNPETTNVGDRRKMIELFEERIETRHIDLSEHPKWPTKEQEALWRVVTLVKWIVNGGTRGWERDKMGVYKKETEEKIKTLTEFF